MTHRADQLRPAHPLTITGRPSLLGMRPPQLLEWMHADGAPARIDECRRLLAHVIAGGNPDLDAITKPLARSFREDVTRLTDRGRLAVVERVEDGADGFVKYLFRSPDGALTEAVRIPLETPGAFSICLSSQVGCAMQCTFCATGRLGLTRHLQTWEMVSAFLTVRDEAPGRVTGAVFMGQGEPLHNYDAVIEAARVLSHPCGGRIHSKAISISTVGLAPQIRRYTREGHKFRLIVSLTSAVEERRAALLPVAGAWPLDDVVDAIAEHAASRSGRTTVAWVLMGGVNDGQDEVDALQRRLAGLPLRFNIIDVNDARTDGFRTATAAERARFLAGVSALDVPMVRRYSGGKSRHAACGMLAARRSIADEPGDAPRRP